LLGWAALLVLVYLIEQSLLRWTVPWIGRDWFPTELVVLNCLALAATGWVIGRTSGAAWKLCLAVFALTLLFRDFSPELAINVPWLIQLAADATRDSTYLSSLGATTAAHLLLFGSLAAGGFLSRPAEAPVSIVDPLTDATGSGRGR